MDMILDSKDFENKVEKIIKNTENKVRNNGKGIENAFGSSMKKVGILIASAFAVDKVVDFSKSAVNAASKVQSAWTGLNSIVQGTGNSFSEAQSFINDFTKDGLMSIQETATAYKNLLSRGYDTTQIENTLIALKDSAAFGRQASYDLGEAVVGATEGLKNENSILVDNAGVTKNVAKMWEEYADSIGVSSTSLTQAQKIQAEYNGIMKETRFQVGDAATYTKTFAGQTQMLKASFTSMQVAIGKVITPIAQLFIPVINSAINAITVFFNKMQSIIKVFGLEMPDVVSKTSSSISNVGNAANGITSDIQNTGDTAVKAAKKINKAFGSVDEINVLKTNKDSDSNSGASSSGDSTSTSIAITPSVPADNTVSSAVSSTVEKIKKYIEPLQNISFDNLIDAFSELKDNLIAFGGHVFSGLEWFYFNILIPLGKWTIEDVLPAFLNLLSGALSFLNQVITDIQPILLWLWDYILQPIAKWTGGAIVSVLNGIGDALEWIGKNELAMAILEGLAISIGLVSGALAIWNVAVGAWNAIGTIATAVTTAFGVAVNILTSPITLVVLAIGALIAIIILLVSHWEEITAAVQTAWDNICNFVSTGVEKVKEFFNGIINFVKDNWQGLLLFIVNPFAGAFKLLYDNCEGFRNTIDNVLESVKNAFSNAFNSVKQTISDIWNNILKIFSKGGKIFDGIKDGISNVFKTIVNGLLTGVNKVIAVPFNTINKMLNKIRNTSFLGVSPFKGLWKENPLSVPQIPMLAQGGYVGANNPQLAIIGDNTREGEIVAPESKIYDQVSKAIKDNTGATKQEIAITIYHKYEDGKTIIQKINQAEIDAGKILLLT